MTTCLDLFAGAGGASLGLHRAGLRHLACVEWDRDACATLRAAGGAGFLDTGDVIEGDIREVDWNPYAGRVDVLWASPPCQAWSSAGKRLGAADERNGWPWTWDAVDAIRPRWLIAENVEGMLMHAGGADACPRGRPEACPACYWNEIILPAARVRFAWVGFRVLDSADYGVPQHRNRVYLVCGPRPIRWPDPNHADPATLAQVPMFRELKPWATVRDALGLEGLSYRRGRDGGSRFEGHDGGEPAQALRGSAGGSSQPFANCSVQREDPSRGWEGDFADGPAPSLRSDRPGGGIAIVRHPPATQGSPAPTIRSGGEGHSAPPLTLAASEPWRLDMPSPAVLATEIKGARHQGNADADRTPARASDALWRATGRRRLTVEECAALMSWPVGYPLQGTKTSRYRQVGNGCTPPVVEVLGRAVTSADGARP